MQDRQSLIQSLEEIRNYGRMSKLGRMMKAPLKYLQATFFTHLVYPSTKKSRRVKADTFFGTSLNLELPGGMDIYLSGGKTHESEIRLALYIIKNLEPSALFIDAGAHVGYFSLLAASLLDEGGKVIAIEAAPPTYELLKLNTENHSSITSILLALSDKKSDISFWVYPALYSEYNSFSKRQHDNAEWIKKYPPVEVTVHADKIDHLISGVHAGQVLLKIDVEGFEATVLRGAEELLKSENIHVIMEWVDHKEVADNYQKALKILLSHGYSAYSLNENGETIPCADPIQEMRSRRSDSENFVFLKMQT